MNDTKVGVKKIDLIILVGGTIKVPIVKEVVEKKFGKEKVVDTPQFDPMTAVAKGAARYARSYNMPSEEDDQPKLVTEIPESIGIEVLGGKMRFIAHKGDKTPINWEHTFVTSIDNQDRIEFDLLKGESEYAMNNEYISEYIIDNLPKKPKGQVKVKLTIDIEQSGNIVMKAACVGTNQETVEKRVSCFDHTEEKLKKSLDKISKYFPV